jgi:hypothetical protein
VSVGLTYQADFIVIQICALVHAPSATPKVLKCKSKAQPPMSSFLHRFREYEPRIDFPRHLQSFHPSQTLIENHGNRFYFLMALGVQLEDVLISP